MRSIGSAAASIAHSPSAADSGSGSAPPFATICPNACASVAAAGTNKSGARSRTSSKVEATDDKVLESAPNVSASRVTSVPNPTPAEFGPMGDGVGPGPSAAFSEEVFGGINLDASFLQRPLDLRLL